ncbi:MAG: YihY/virulence factor BrkB family protein [Acidobacteriota bacterium]|nr:YihY/virulence factor BrkB family protein [Acidobacteriota bacterium]
MTAGRARPGGQIRLIGLATWRGVGELYDSDAMTHAASVAYYALISLFPFLLLALAILGEVTSNAAERDSVVRFVFRYFPRQFDFITGQLDSFQTAPVSFGAGGILMLVWAATGVFNALTSAVNHAWGVEKRRSFLKHRLVSFLMLASAGGVLLIGLILASVVRLAESSRFGEAIGEAPWVGWASGLTGHATATALLVMCVALVFYFIPNTKVRFRDVWPGALMVGILWRMAFSLFAWYASDLATWNVIHGSLAAVVVFLIWIYVSVVILLYGVEITAIYARLQDAAERHPDLAPIVVGPPPGTN